MSSVWARDGCPVILLVLCDEAEVAAQYAQPIRIGRAAIVFPDVIGPDQVPVVRRPELALATALMTVGTGLGASTMTWCWRSSLSHRKRIGQCTDIDQLDAWLRRVGSVASVDELFA